MPRWGFFLHLAVGSLTTRITAMIWSIIFLISSKPIPFLISRNEIICSSIIEEKRKSQQLIKQFDLSSYFVLEDKHFQQEKQPFSFTSLESISMTLP